ncbi:MAG: MYG1 family protein [Candidatus Protochlamydia sp.]|nr:MYG1 family protein [Candidatus Protochlamydia sp.]
MEKNFRSCGTHDGTFHADEVTACALLMLFQLIDQNKIIRTRDLDQLARCEFVCDVGGFYDPSQKLFDHHQADYQGPLSSAGMILKYLEQTGKLKKNEYEFFNNSLVMGIDAHDNGRDPLTPGYCSISHIVSNFTPIHYECSPAEQNDSFHEALNFIYGHLKRLWDRFQYTQSCRESVAECMAKCQECLIFEKNLPWMDIFFELNGETHPALFVIMPSGAHWKLRGIPPTYQDRMKVRLPLPQEWAGLLDEELKIVSGIPGAIFCHKGRFISVWETKDDALKALEYTLSKEAIR